MENIAGIRVRRVLFAFLGHSKFLVTRAEKILFNVEIFKMSPGICRGYDHLMFAGVYHNLIEEWACVSQAISK